MQVARDNVWNLYCRYSSRIRTRIRIHIRIQMRESLKLYAKKRNKEKPLQKTFKGARERWVCTPFYSASIPWVRLVSQSVGWYVLMNVINAVAMNSTASLALTRLTHCCLSAAKGAGAAVNVDVSSGKGSESHGKYDAKFIYIFLLYS